MVLPSRLKALIALASFMAALSSASASGFHTPKLTSEAESEASNFGRGLFIAYYSFVDLGHAKESGLYGFKDIISAYQSGSNHICVSFGVAANYGIVDNGGIMFDLGPAFRTDISKSVSLAIPLELTCGVYSYTNGDGDVKTEVAMGGQLGAVLMVKPSKVGFYLGPQLTFDKHNTSIGLMVGLGF